MAYWETAPSQASTHQIISLKPGKGRTLTFLNEKKRLTGQLMLRGDETGPQTVTLQPWAVLTGRVVNAEGEPWGEEVQLYPVNLPGGYPKVGRDGRFRIEGLMPGKSYSLQILSGSRLGSFVVRDVKVGPGEVKDLGDVVPETPKSE